MKALKTNKNANDENHYIYTLIGNDGHARMKKRCINPIMA